MYSEKVLLILGCLLHAHSTLAIWSCTQDADCSSTVDSVCERGACVCPPGKQVVLGGTLCADVAPYHFSPCIEDFQCSRLFTTFQCRRPDNATEVDPGNCGCTPGNHYFRGRCWPIRDLGDTCSSSEECLGNLRDPFSMTCSSGVCTCSDGYFMRQRGECRRRATAVGESCVLDDDCQFPGGVCDNQVTPFTCIFREPTGPTPPVGPTQPPSLTTPVTTTQPPATTQPPTTQPPVTTESTTRPITPPPITFPPITFPPLITSPPQTTVTTETTGNPEARNPETTGNSETIKDSSNLRSVSRNDGTYGATCSTQFPCSDQFECSSFGTCICPRGYYPDAQRSICLAELGSPVTSSNQCVGLFTEVRDGICSCWANFYFDEDMRTCVKAVRRITDACLTDANCQTFGAHSYCGPPGEWGLRSCECDRNTTVWDANRHICRLFAGVGETCEVDSDCLAGELEIQCVVNAEGEGRCTCPPGFDELDGLCLTLGLGLGEECQVNMECSNTDNAECQDSVCACAAGYQQVGDICAPMLGGTCNADSDCVIENTGCSGITSTCQCTSGFVEYEDYCWTAVTELDAPCNITAQCIDPSGGPRECREGQCMCPQGTHYRDGSCWPQTGLFESCSRSSQCYLSQNSERVHCRNSLCQCTFDYPYSEDLGTCTSSATMILANMVVIMSGVIYLFSS